MTGTAAIPSQNFIEYICKDVGYNTQCNVLARSPGLAMLFFQEAPYINANAARLIKEHTAALAITPDAPSAPNVATPGAGLRASDGASVVFERLPNQAGQLSPSSLVGTKGSTVLVLRGHLQHDPHAALMAQLYVASQSELLARAAATLTRAARPSTGAGCNATQDSPRSQPASPQLHAMLRTSSADSGDAESLGSLEAQVMASLRLALIESPLLPPDSTPTLCRASVPGPPPLRRELRQQQEDLQQHQLLVAGLTADSSWEIQAQSFSADQLQRIIQFLLLGRPLAPANDKSLFGSPTRDANIKRLLNLAGLRDIATGNVSGQGLSFCLGTRGSQIWVIIYAILLELTQPPRYCTCTHRFPNKAGARVCPDCAFPIFAHNALRTAALDLEDCLTALVALRFAAPHTAYRFPDKGQFPRVFQLLLRLADVGLVYPIQVAGASTRKRGHTDEGEGQTDQGNAQQQQQQQQQYLLVSPFLKEGFDSGAGSVQRRGRVRDDAADFGSGSDTHDGVHHQGASSAASAPQHIHFTNVMITETNLRIYAYAPDATMRALLEQFTEPELDIPGLVCRSITREAFTEALRRGMTSANIIKFLHIAAHPVMPLQPNGTVIAASVCDQLHMWESEYNRVQFTDDCVLINGTSERNVQDMVRGLGIRDSDVIYRDRFRLVMKRAVFHQFVARSGADNNN